MATKHRNRFKLLTLGISGFIGASIIFLMIAYHGAGITPDSVAYISVARNFADGNGLLVYNGTPLIYQPPLYPVILSVIKKAIQIDPMLSAGFLNALLFGFMIYISGLLMLRLLNSFTLVLLGTTAVLISYPLVQASFMALSETLFILLVMLFLYYFEKYKSNKNLLSLIIFSVSASLACLTRYTGVILILTGITCIFFLPENNLKEKLKHSIIFTLITVLPIGIWVIRNYILSGTFFGLRAASSYTLFENVKIFLDTVLLWYFQLNSYSIILILIFILLSIRILFVLYPTKSMNREAIKLIGPSLLFMILYSGIIVISSTTTAYDRISDRLLSPINIPLIIFIFFIMDKTLCRLAKYFSLKSINSFIIICLVLFIRFPATNTIHIFKDFIELSGWGYSCNSWQESETIKYLNKHELLAKDYTLYSNEPEAVYILTNHKTLRSPFKTYYNSHQLYLKTNGYDIWQNAKNVCLVWFDNTNRDFLFTIDELKIKNNMTEIAHLKDGEIYTFSQK